MSKKTKFFFSGISNQTLPEVILAEHDPSVLLTYFEIDNFKQDTIRRLTRHSKKVKEKLGIPGNGDEEQQGKRKKEKEK